MHNYDNAAISQSVLDSVETLRVRAEKMREKKRADHVRRQATDPSYRELRKARAMKLHQEKRAGTWTPQPQKLTEEQKREIRKQFLKDVPIHRLAKSYDVSGDTIVYALGALHDTTQQERKELDRATASKVRELWMTGEYKQSELAVLVGLHAPAISQYVSDLPRRRDLGPSRYMREEVAAAYADRTIKLADITKRFGISRDQMYRMLDKAGVPRRNRYPKRREGKPKV